MADPVGRRRLSQVRLRLTREIGRLSSGEVAMFRTVLVPLDGTPFGEHALPLAVSVARRSGAALHLVRLHVPTVSAEGPVLLDVAQDHEEQGRERAYLGEVAGRVTARAAELTVT